MDRNAVNRHEFIAHYGNRDFKCHVCSYTCFERGVLRQHLSRVHGVILPSKITFVQPDKKVAKKSAQTKGEGKEAKVKVEKVESETSWQGSRVVSGDQSTNDQDPLENSEPLVKENPTEEEHYEVDDLPDDHDDDDVDFTPNNNAMSSEQKETNEENPDNNSSGIDGCGNKEKHSSEASLTFMQQVLNERGSQGDKQKRKAKVTRPFRCGLCNRSFSLEESLMHHMMKHAGQKPFKCDFCPTRFKTKIDCVAHMRKHTGERPFSCEFCRKTFVRVERYNAHIRLHKARTKKEHVCTVCKKAFATKTYLRCHMQRHTVQSHQCDVCDQTFTQLEYLKRHRVRHLGEQPKVKAAPPSPQKVLVLQELSFWRHSNRN